MWCELKLLCLWDKGSFFSLISKIRTWCVCALIRSPVRSNTQAKVEKKLVGRYWTTLQSWRITTRSSSMNFEEYMAKSSLQSGIEPLYSYSYISADSNLYRRNRESPGSKRKFSTEPGNKSSEEWNETAEERNQSSDEFSDSSVEIRRFPPRNCSISLIVPSMTSS